MEHLSRAEIVEALLRELGHSSAQAGLLTQELAAKLGIASTDLQCLGLLRENGPTTAGQLAELTGLTTGAITGVIDRLERAGYVSREADPQDRRRVVVQAVPERGAQVARLYEPLSAAVTRALAACSDRDAQLLLDFQRQVTGLLRDESRRLRTDIPRPPEGAGLTAPLASAAPGRLEMANGASQLMVRAEPALDGLYRAYFEGPQPSVKVEGNHVTIRYRRFSVLDWGRHSGQVELNPAIDWDLFLNGGASKVTVDARGLKLTSLELHGGASAILVLLGWPKGVVPIRVHGGVSKVEIYRPEGASAELRVGGGASRLQFDAQRFGAVGGEVRLSNLGSGGDEDRYVFDVAGGASRLNFEAVPVERLVRWPGLPGADLAQR